MSEDKPEEKREQTEAKKPPEAPAKEAVIGASPQQDRWKQMERAHYLEQDESATGLFYPKGTEPPATEKFRIDGLGTAPKQNANGTPYQDYKQEAGQAVQGLDPLLKPMTESAFQSSVKMQIQVTQVPEVTRSVTAQGALKYTSTVMEAGAQSVRQIEEHLAKPGAINRDLLDMAIAGYKAPGYLSDTERVKKDFQSLLTGAAQKVDEVVQQIDKPMTPEQRAKMAGTMLPLFFFEGGKQPIDQKVVQQMKLEKMTEEELKALGIERKVSEIGVDAVGKALRFSEESGIEVGECRLGPDKVWDQAPFPRGNDVHVVLGENLPAGTKTIDRVVFKDGIAEGQKSLDLTADTYAFPRRLESRLKGYVHDMELYKGQKQLRMSFRMQQQEIEQKILHIGIKNGSISEPQKEVFERIGKQIKQYNENLPIGKAPIKLKVTVVK